MATIGPGPGGGQIKFPGRRPIRPGAPPATPAPAGTVMTPAVTIRPPVGSTPPPVTPPAPAGAPLPFDPIYEGQVGINTTSFNNTNVGLDQEQSGAVRSYGLDDPSDPFSRAALLKQVWQQRGRASGNSLAARGQLYSGAYQNAQNANALGQEQGLDSLRKGQNAVLANIAARRASARTGRDQGNLDAFSAAIGRASQVRPDPATLATADKSIDKSSIAVAKRRRDRFINKSNVR